MAESQKGSELENLVLAGINAQRHERKEKDTALEARMNALEEENQHLRSKLDAAKKQIQFLNSKISAAKEQIQDLKSRMSTLETRIQELQSPVGLSQGNQSGDPNSAQESQSIAEPPSQGNQVENEDSNTASLFD